MRNQTETTGRRKALLTLAMGGAGAVAALVALYGAGPGALTALLPTAADAATGQAITVSSADQFMAVLDSVPAGGTIALRPGTYAPITILNRDKPLTITSADPANPAVLGGLVVRQGGNVTIRSVTLLQRTGGGPPIPFGVLDGHDVIFDQILLTGDDLSTAGPGGPQAGIMLRNSRNIAITNSSFTKVWNAIAHLNGDGLKITHNEFHDIRTDGIHGGGTSNVVISGNYFTDFYPQGAVGSTGDHADAVQFWTTNTTSSAQNITITDNVFSRGKGRFIQGIFMRDETEKLPYRNVVISGNLVIGALYNGIAVYNIQGGKVTDNEVIAFPDQLSWLSVKGGGDVVVRDNRAPQFITDVPTGLAKGDNVTNQRTTSKIGDRIRQWIDARPERQHQGSALRTEMVGAN